MSDPLMSSPLLFEYLFDGLRFAWVTLAALSIFTGAWLSMHSDRENNRDIEHWQWAVFFWFGAALFIFMISGHYIEKSAILILFEGAVIVFATALYLALLIHVRHSRLLRTPQEIALDAVRSFLR